VSKAFGNPKLASVSRDQGHADPFAVCRRRATNVDRDVEDRPRHWANELALRSLGLKVKPAQDVACRATVIVLRENRWQTDFGEFLGAVHLSEESTIVGVHGALDHTHTG